MFGYRDRQRASYLRCFPSGKADSPERLEKENNRQREVQGVQGDIVLTISREGPAEHSRVYRSKRSWTMSFQRYLAGNVALFWRLLVGSAGLIVLNNTLGTSFRDLPESP